MTSESKYAYKLHSAVSRERKHRSNKETQERKIVRECGRRKRDVTNGQRLKGEESKTVRQMKGLVTSGGGLCGVRNVVV